MMAGEIGEQAIQVEWKTAQITAKALQELIKQLLANKHRITHGEQKLSKLNNQQKQLESVDISSNDMKSFRRELNKYSVDFSIKQNKETGNYTVFFKTQDVDRVYSGLEKCVAAFEKNKNTKKPMKEQMNEAQTRAALINNNKNSPEQEIKSDRGKEKR